MSDLIFRISPNLVLGSYTISRLGQYVKEWGTRFMIIMDPILNEAKLPEKISQTLQDRKLECFIFSELSEGNSSKTIERALALAKEGHIHGVIGIGGEKAINISRAVAALYNEIHDFYTFADGAIPSTSPLPFICIPTTYRTSFVFTPDLPIIDARSHQLKMMKIQNNVCKLMVVDPNMMLTLTESQKATFSIELIAMAIEAYLSQKANFFSDMFVEKGLEILSYALDGSPSLEITTPQEVLLSQAGAMISIATASSSLGLGSILALSIYSRYHINKSLINSILLPYVLEEDAKFKESKLEKIAQIMRIDQIEGTEEKPSGAELVKLLIEYVRQKNAKNNLPTRLKDLKLTIDNLSLAIEDISQNFIVNCLPRSMTSDDIFEFVKNAF